MILWTIQTKKMWQEFQSSGTLRGTREGIMDQYFESAYEWMIGQMRRRIGPPPTPETYPIWAWFQWENAERAKPDLRSSGHLSKGKLGARIEFECPDKATLLSDFDLWHYVLNYFPNTNLTNYTNFTNYFLLSNKKIKIKICVIRLIRACLCVSSRRQGIRALLRKQFSCSMAINL